MASLQYERRERNRLKTLRLLRKYGETALTKEIGNELLTRNGYTNPDMNHDEMVHRFQTMANSLNPVKIYRKAENLNNSNHSVDAMISSCMSVEMKEISYRPLREQPTDLAYLPVYDTTQDIYHKAMALAAIDPTTWKLHGLLRMDDPEAASIYEKMKASINACFDETKQGSTEPYEIPESETTGFIDSFSPDMQYE